MTAFHRPCVCLVTDRRQLTPDARTVRDELTALERFLDEAIEAGVDVIQVREPDLDAAALVGCVSLVVGRARQGRTLVLVNDRADVAIASAADGVHLGARGLPIGRVRSLDAHWTIGRSIHPGDLSGAYGDADYLFFGTVFQSRSKPPDAPVAGFAALRAAVTGARVPVLAIGGITPVRAGACAAAGAAGVAAIGLFLPVGRTPESIGVAAAVRELRAALESAGTTS